MNKSYSISKKSQFLAILIFQFFVVQQAKSQISAFSFTQNTITPYAEITGGTVVATATGSSGVTSLDDVIYNLPSGTIPFSFVMNNLAYTGCNISSNGFITFGATAPAANVYIPLSSATAYESAISLMGVNLNSYFYSGNALQNGEIRYNTTGISPNRVFTIQWKNFKPSAIVNSPFANGVNGQIKLYESSNIIELCYKTTTAYTGITPQIGLRGINNTFPTNINNRLVASAGNWSSSTNGVANSSTCSLNSTFPLSGLIYRYTPPCFTPTNLPVSNIHKTDVQISWSSLVSGTAKLEYGPSGFLLGSGTIINNATSPQIISGLVAGTNYQYYISTNCTSGGTSSNIGPFSFTTARTGDDCASAPTIALINGVPVAGNYTTVSSGITSDGPNALCSDATGRVADDDMWYKFVAPATVTNKLVITSTAGTNNDWVMEVWSACGGTVLKCSDDVNASMPEITICQNEYTPNQIFYVRVWTYTQGATGTMNLCAYLATSQCVIPPVNDECLSATTLQIGIPQSCPGSTQSFSTNFATASAGLSAPTCGTGTILDEFFKFNTGFKGSFTLTLKAVSAPIIKAALLFDCAGAELQCFSPVAGGSTYTISGLNDVADYYIRVWSPSGQSGSFEICLADVCDDAKATLSGSIGICSTGTAQLKVDLTGIGPWNLVYSNGISNFNVTANSTPFFIPVSPTTTTSYNLVSVTSAFCAGTVSGSATVTILPPPVVSLAALAPACQNTSIALSGGLPSGGAYSGLGVTGGIFNPSSLVAGTYTITYSYGVGSGCSRSASQPITVKTAPSITSFSPGIGPIGSQVVINGSNFNGANIVRFNTTNAISYNIPNNNLINAIVPVGTTTGLIYIQLPNGCSTTSNLLFGIGAGPVFANLTVKAYLQGFYLGGGQMTAVLDPITKPTVSDSVTVSLAQSTPPFTILSSVKSVLSTTGTGVFSFPGSFANGSYYIVVNHRNSMETWSRSPKTLSVSGAFFDFTIPYTGQ